MDGSERRGLTGLALQIREAGMERSLLRWFCSLHYCLPPSLWVLNRGSSRRRLNHISLRTFTVRMGGFGLFFGGAPAVGFGEPFRGLVPGFGSVPAVPGGSGDRVAAP
ncbi:unnamed protein product [Musa acuminata subsp. burmannicoides]